MNYNKTIYIPISNYKYKETILGVFTNKKDAFNILIDHILTYYRKNILNGLVPTSHPKYHTRINTYNDSEITSFINTFKNTITNLKKLKKYWNNNCLARYTVSDKIYWTFNIKKCIIDEYPEINYNNISDDDNSDSDNSSESDDSDDNSSDSYNSSESDDSDDSDNSDDSDDSDDNSDRTDN